MQWHNDLWHPEWGVITVGYDCAEKLGNPEADSKRKFYKRAVTFINSPRWKETKHGEMYKHGDVKVFVMEKMYQNNWRYILNINDVWGKKYYYDRHDALFAAFKYIEGC